MLAMIVTMLLLTACNGDSSKQSSGKEDVVTIKLFSSHGQFNRGKFGEQQLKEFEKANPNIKIELTSAHGNQWNDTFLALASSGDLPDVFMPTNTFTLADLIHNKWVQPYNGLVSEQSISQFDKNVFAEGINVSKGKIYSFPRVDQMSGNVQLYHKDIMEKNGLDPKQPPQTWNQLLDMSKKVTDKKNGVYGLVLPLKEDYGWKLAVMSLAQSLQPTLDISGFDYQKGQYDFNSPAIIQAFEFVLKLRDEGVIHPNSPTLSLLDAQGLFANKKAAFNFNGQHIVRVNEKELGAPKNYNVSSIPVAKEGQKSRQLGIHAGVNAFISSNTKHPKEAAKLIEFLGSKDYYKKQIKDDLLLSPMTDLSQDSSNFTNEQLKQMAEVFSNTVIARPIIEGRSGVTEVKKIETTLPKAQPDWWEILQGAYIGEVKDWKGALTKVNNTYNKNLKDAIKIANEKGTKVTPEDFQTADFDAKTNYTK